MSIYPGGGFYEDMGVPAPEPPWPGSASEREVMRQRARDAARRERNGSMLQELRNFDVNRLALDEMFALSAFGKMVRSEYQNRNLPVPEWLNDQLSLLEREILARRRDELERRLKEVQATRSTLETASEKRERLAREEEELKKQLQGA